MVAFDGFPALVSSTRRMNRSLGSTWSSKHGINEQ